MELLTPWQWHMLSSWGVSATGCYSHSKLERPRRVRRASATVQSFRRSSIGGGQNYGFNVDFHRKKQRGFCSSQRRVDFNYTSSIPPMRMTVGLLSSTARSSGGLCPCDDQLFESAPSGVALGRLGGDEEGVLPPPALQLSALLLAPLC